MRWKDDIPEEVKEDRLQRLIALHEEISSEQRHSFLGNEAEVLVERKNRDGQLKGRTRCWKKVIFPGDDSMIGTLQRVRLHSCNHQTLIGDLATATARA